jgi:hypothetical protein
MTGATFTLVKADGQTEEVPLVGRVTKQVWTCGVPAHEHEAKADALKCDGEEIEKRAFSQKERDKAAESGAAMPDGSFPIKNKGDLKNAIRLAGNAKNPAAAKAHIKSRAKALGATDMIPDTWSKIVISDSVQKCLYGVASLATAISQVEYVEDIEKREAAAEGDTASTVPANLEAATSALYEALVAMVEEEAEESQSDEGDDAMAMAVVSTLEKINSKPERLRELLSKRAEEEEDMKPEEFQKIVGDSRDALTKTMNEGLQKLDSRIGEVETGFKAELAKVAVEIDTIKKAVPAPTSVVKNLHAASKEKDDKDEKVESEKAAKDMSVLELAKIALRPEHAIRA